MSELSQRQQLECDECRTIRLGDLSDIVGEGESTKQFELKTFHANAIEVF